MYGVCLGIKASSAQIRKKILCKFHLYIIELMLFKAPLPQLVYNRFLTSFA